MNAFREMFETVAAYESLFERIAVQTVFFAGVLWLVSFLRKAVCARLFVTARVPVFWPFAFVVKCLTQKFVVKRSENGFLFVLMPFLTFFLSALAFLFVPFLTFFAVTEIQFDVLYALFVLYSSVCAFVSAGLVSDSRYALISAVRALMRLVSVQAVLVVVVMTVMLSADATCFRDIADAQKKIWFVLPHFPLVFIFTACTLFLLNVFRFESPFAHKELASGVYAEYAGGLYLLLRLSAYVSAVFMAAVGAFLFLGGDNAPFETRFVPSWVWLGVKTGLFFVVFVVAENALPDYRSDKMPKIALLRFFPFCVLWLFATAAVCLLLSGGVV